MFGIRSRKIISLLIIDAKCTGCGTCIDKCRRNVISLAEEGGYKWRYVRMNVPVVADVKDIVRKTLSA